MNIATRSSGFGQLVSIIFIILVFFTWIFFTTSYIGNENNSDFSDIPPIDRESSYSPIAGTPLETEFPYKILEEIGLMSSMYDRIKDAFRTIIIEEPLEKENKKIYNSFFPMFFGMFLFIAIVTLTVYFDKIIILIEKLISGANTRSRSEVRDSLSFQKKEYARMSAHVGTNEYIDYSTGSGEALQQAAILKYKELLRKLPLGWEAEHEGQYVAVGLKDDTWSIAPSMVEASRTYRGKFFDPPHDFIVLEVGNSRQSKSRGWANA